MNLYELTEQWEAVLALQEGGADSEAVQNALDDIGGAIEEKAVGYAKVIRNLEAEAAACKEEKERFYKREQAKKSLAQDLKKRLEEAMVRCGKTKIQTELFNFNIQKNAPSLCIDDETRLMEWLNLHHPELVVKKLEINKEGLKKALKDGLEMDYASIKQSESLRIR